MPYEHPKTGVIHTGYAFAWDGKYQVVTMDWFSGGLCTYPSSNQESPQLHMDLERVESAREKIAEWHSSEIKIISLRYCDGEWIDQPSEALENAFK